jgi:hypothetical protein
MVNPVCAGFVAGGILARTSGPKGVLAGGAAFAAFSAAIDLFLRRETPEYVAFSLQFHRAELSPGRIEVQTGDARCSTLYPTSSRAYAISCIPTLNLSLRGLFGQVDGSSTVLDNGKLATLASEQATRDTLCLATPGPKMLCLPGEYSVTLSLSVTNFAYRYIIQT